MGSSSEKNPLKNPLALALPAFYISNAITGMISTKAENVPTPETPPPPTPMPSATDRNPQETERMRQRKLASLQYGFASTISKARNPLTSTMSTTGALKTRLGQ